MTTCSRALRNSPLARGIGALLVALAFAVALPGCKDDDKVVIPPATVGALNVNVNPASATVVVTGPTGFTQQTFTGNKLIADLQPGQYTASATALGFISAVSSINVIAGYTSTISLNLVATGIISGAPRVVYRNGNGDLIPIDSSILQSGKIFIYAWLQNLPDGISPAEVISLTGVDPGQPLPAEQVETAPSFTQNLAVAWVGFMDPTGVVRPVIGADVRWEIDTLWSGRVNSTLFGASDDNGVALGTNYGIDNNQADTRTNNASLENESFPFAGGAYPLYNQSGIGTPFVDGFTWVTVYSPDATAAARITAVAHLTLEDGKGGEVGDKQILLKSFAPAPKLEITKTVDQALVNLPTGGTGTVTWTVTVTNVGTGDATNVCLHDFLASGAAGNYVSNPASPFDFPCFDLPAASAPTPPVAQLLGNAGSFAVLANGTVTNTGSSVVKGNVGVSAGSAITGFPPGLVVDGTIHNNDAVAQAAQVAVTAAYTNLQARPATHATVDPSNLTLGPGVYPYESALLITGPVVLDAGGDPNAEFVFKVGSALTTASGTSVSLVNGASPCNVYWQVGTSATLGSSSFFVGSILAQESITANTGATISGRALARTGSVTLAGNPLSAPLSCGAGTPAPSTTHSLTFTATVDAAGTYCNEVQVFSYEGGTLTFTPADLNAQACFTAVQPELTIIKDFVADDNTTSLGKARTVAASVPAKLRVRVFNNGTGPATAVQVNDALTSGTLANYSIIVPSGSTANASGGFDTTAADLAAGASTTLLFTVAASADGEYCDTATVTATSGCTGALCSDTACLTVATPILEITKADAPASVLPGANYTSTIVVSNTGSATARTVVVSDLLGLNSAANVLAIYVSSSQNGLSGTLANNVVTAPNAVDIPAGGSMTFTVVSRIPLAAVSGTYCDTATVTSSNAATKQASDCVDVPAFSALQTQLIDLADPVAVGSDVTYFQVAYVESLSNEGVGNNVFTYSYGLVSPTVLGIPGVFDVTSTKVYLDSAPVRDPVTGLVVSDATSATAVLKTVGTDYTLSAAQLGFQVITMAPNVVLQPNTALYVVSVVRIPAGTIPNMYTTSYIWDSVGLVNPTHHYQASSSEPTTVLP